MNCPKCGWSQPEAEECVRCGIIFEKFFASRDRKRRQAPPPSPGRAGREEVATAEGPLAAAFRQWVRVPWNSPWRPLSRQRVIGLSLVFGYIIYSIAREPFYDLYPEAAPMNYWVALVFKQVNLVFHEGGHWIFGIFGNETLTVLGGSLNQVLVPLGVAGAFWFRRDASGFAFALLWLGINLLEVGIYMADARKLVLPLIGGMDPFEGHDWRNLFNWWDLWHRDTMIARTTYRLGWGFLLLGLPWFLWTAWRYPARGDVAD